MNKHLDDASLSPVNRILFDMTISKRVSVLENAPQFLNMDKAIDLPLKVNHR